MLEKGRGKALVFVSLGVGYAGIVLIAERAASQAGFQPPPSFAGLWLPIVALCLALGLWMTFSFTRQLGPRSLNLQGKPLVLQIPLFVLFTAMMLLLFSSMAGGFIGLPAYGFLGMTLVRNHPGLPEWLAFPLSGALLLASLAALVLAFSMTRRAVWLWKMRKRIENLPTSTVRGAAVGLVELKGIARRIGQAPPERPLLGFNPAFQQSPSPLPPYAFHLEDPTGRVRIDPPENRDGSMDARLHLRPGAGGCPVLMEGDPVLVIGSLEPDPEAPLDATGPDRLVVRPCSPPSGRLGSRFRWLEAELISGSGVFLVTNGDEQAAKRSLTRWRLWWLLLGGLQTTGALAAVASALGLFRPSVTS